MQAYHVKSAGRESRITATNSVDAARKFVKNSCRADGTHCCAEIVFVSDKPFKEKKACEIEFLSTELIIKSMGIDVPRPTMKIVQSDEKSENDVSPYNPSTSKLKICQ